MFKFTCQNLSKIPEEVTISYVCKAYSISLHILKAKTFHGQDVFGVKDFPSPL